ncbi:hypothetical protein AWENTII_011773 [Aspergillus wentii]
MAPNLQTPLPPPPLRPKSHLHPNKHHHPPLSPNHLLLKTLYLSNDPAQRGWISPNADPARLYVPPVPTGAVMRSTGIAEVIESLSPSHPPGSLVFAVTNWSEYTVVHEGEVQRITPVDGLGVTHFLGSLGLPGLTAYYGLKEVVKTTSEDVVVVSGAAGATGGMAVQIAKRILGCKRVIGIAGTDEKCRWVESHGADVCINYRKETFEKDLFRETEGFVDVFYDNVGGKILDLMLLRMKRHGRIAACGTISNYNKNLDPVGIKNYYEVVSNRISIHGFIVFDYMHKAAEVRELFLQAWKEGKIILSDDTETVIEAPFEDIPEVWLKLFDGSNRGKLTTKLIG